MESDLPRAKQLRTIEAQVALLLAVVFGPGAVPKSRFHPEVFQLDVERLLQGSRLPPETRHHIYAEFADFIEEEHHVRRTRDRSDRAWKYISPGGGLIGRIRTLRKSVEREAQTLTTFRRDVLPYLTAQSLGLNLNEVPLRRFVAASVYTSSDENVAEMWAAVERLLAAMGFVVAEDLPARRGSWFKQFVAKSKETLAQPEVNERLQKIEHALELAKIQKTQADVDAKEAEAASALIAALCDTPNAACQIGSILLLKITDDHGTRLVTRTLTPAEMIHLAKNQHLLNSPADLLAALAAASEGVSEQPESPVAPAALSVKTRPSAGAQRALEGGDRPEAGESRR
jgi:hypothetical protein